MKNKEGKLTAVEINTLYAQEIILHGKTNARHLNQSVY
jgi:hypothetical protein